MSLFDTLAILKQINPWKTIYFNLHYFPLKIALRLPFFIYWRTDLHKMKGRIVIDAPLSTGLVKIGPHGLGTQDRKYSRTIWEVHGCLIVQGKTNIGRGSKICIGKEGTLKFGRQLFISGNSDIICQKEISFGEDCLLSWDILIMDTDFHPIFNEKKEIVNAPKAVHIGDHVWIGCRNTILKGVSVANHCVISANSTITRSFTEEHCIIGGSGKEAKIIKTGIDWEH